MDGQYIELQVEDGSTMMAYVVTPEGDGPFPAVLILQEAFGVNHHIRRIAERIGGEGWLAIAPEFFHRTAPAKFEGVYTDFETVKPHTSALTAENISLDLRATYDWLIDQDNVKKMRIGSLGFCMGGRVSFMANALLPLSAGVSFYSGGMLSVLSLAKQVHAPHLFFWGGLDKHITPDQIDSVVNAMKEAGKEFTNVVISDADHGFNCDERAAYQPRAASEAWAMTIAFLKNNLQ